MNTKSVFKRWIPLVISRFCIAAELPMMAYFCAKFANPELNLQALGGIVLTVAVFFESPVWNFLGTSTALVRTRQDYATVCKYFVRLVSIISVCYFGLILTPLFDLLIDRILNAPRALADLAGTGLLIGGIYPWIVGYRRLCQGVLISAGKARLVSVASILRLIALSASMIALSPLNKQLHGVTLVVLAAAFGMVVEAIFSQYFLVKYGLPSLDEREDQTSTLTVRSVSRYCIPLSLSALVQNLSAPIGAAMMFRMPFADFSLTSWPAISGLILLFRTPGFAVLELSAGLAQTRENLPYIRKLVTLIASVLTLIIVVMALTPIGEIYFIRTANLSPEVAHFAQSALIYGIAWPALEVSCCYFMGLAYAWKFTRLSAEATLIALVLHTLGYYVGTKFEPLPGAPWYLLCIAVIYLLEAFWIWLRLSKASR